MTEFRAECTINIHVESRGHPAKCVWSCSLHHAARGRIVLARAFLGKAGREEAELAGVRFGLHQAQRLQQEKVELTATFPVDWLDADGKPGGRTSSSELRSKKLELQQAWKGFRLRRIGKMLPGEAALLKDGATAAFSRKRNKEDK